MATTKKKTTTKQTAKKSAPMRSFAVAKDTPPFFAFHITHQTFYWLLLSALILALGIWVLTLTVRLQDVYNDIDTLQHQSSSTDTKKQ